ncbi:MAG: hypothetical protein RR623_06350 [Bacilli bacterium]
MLNLDSKFLEFLENIELSDSKVRDLRKGRDAIRERISSSFVDEIKPRFRMQGSFAMKTTVQTLNDIEYDLDDGVYLQNFSDKEIYEWESVQTVHNRIFNAVKDHTDDVEDKNPCVRVTYSKNYHIDLPVYIVKDDVAYLAHLTKGWTISDPKALKEWFFERVSENDESLRDIVKLIKAWKDKLNYETEIIDFCGLAITILVGKNYLYNANLADAFLLTLTEIINELNRNCVCFKPVTPTDEDLFSGHSYQQKQELVSRLTNLKSSIEEARNSDNEKIACEKLKLVFGDRFPSGSDQIKNQKFVRTTSQAVLNKDGKSA